MCSVTHKFVLSCGKLIVTLEDVANQLLLPILSDVGLSQIQVSKDKIVMETELYGHGGSNAKLSNWIEDFTKAFASIHRVAFIMFWLSKFIIGLVYHWVSLKPIGHPTVEFFDMELGFS